MEDEGVLVRYVDSTRALRDSFPRFDPRRKWARPESIPRGVFLRDNTPLMHIPKMWSSVVDNPTRGDHMLPQWLNPEILVSKAEAFEYVNGRILVLMIAKGRLNAAIADIDALLTGLSASYEDTLHHDVTWALLPDVCLYHNPKKIDEEDWSQVMTLANDMVELVTLEPAAPPPPKVPDAITATKNFNHRYLQVKREALVSMRDTIAGMLPAFIEQHMRFYTNLGAARMDIGEIFRDGNLTISFPSKIADAGGIPDTCIVRCFVMTPEESRSLPYDTALQHVPEIWEAVDVVEMEEQEKGEREGEEQRKGKAVSSGWKWDNPEVLLSKGEAYAFVQAKMNNLYNICDQVAEAISTVDAAWVVAEDQDRPDRLWRLNGPPLFVDNWRTGVSEWEPIVTTVLRRSYEADFDNLVRPESQLLEKEDDVYWEPPSAWKREHASRTSLGNFNRDYLNIKKQALKSMGDTIRSKLGGLVKEFLNSNNDLGAAHIDLDNLFVDTDDVIISFDHDGAFPASDWDRISDLNNKRSADPDLSDRDRSLVAGYDKFFPHESNYSPPRGDYPPPLYPGHRRFWSV